MRKIVRFFMCLLVCDGVAHAHDNPLLGEYENQISVYLGQGIDSGIIVPPPVRWVPFYILNVQYSQPTTFFKMPARQSMNIGQTVGFGEKYGWHWDKYSIPIAFLSEDVAMLSWCGGYFGGGAGVGLQAQQNERLGAKLLFQLKLFAGVHITNHIGAEIFMQHFSNANTAHANYSYAFYGVGLSYNF